MDGLFRLDIVSQDDGMFVVNTGCVDGNGLKQVAVVSANKLENVASDNPDKLKAEIAFLSTSIHSLQEALRSIAGAVGEFASADGKNIVEKIEFLRKDYEDRIKALEEVVEDVEGIAKALHLEAQSVLAPDDEWRKETWADLPADERERFTEIARAVRNYASLVRLLGREG